MRNKLKNVNNVKKCQRRKKLFAVEAFGGKCQMCGYDKCIDALEFHHVDETTKKEKPSYIIMRWSWEKAKKELEKCILICANCHREIHFKPLDSSISLEEYIHPWISKTCNHCQKEFSTKTDFQKYCSQLCKHLDERKVERPTKEQLDTLLKQQTPWIKIGRMYGVTDNSVRKWAKTYKLI